LNSDTRSFLVRANETFEDEIFITSFEVEESVPVYFSGMISER
jgi:hypothetical protein